MDKLLNYITFLQYIIKLFKIWIKYHIQGIIKMLMINVVVISNIEKVNCNIILIEETRSIFLTSASRLSSKKSL
jgi:hypothetical protein